MASEKVPLRCAVWSMLWLGGRLAELPLLTAKTGQLCVAAMKNGRESNCASAALTVNSSRQGAAPPDGDAVVLVARPGCVPPLCRLQFADRALSKCLFIT